MKELSIEEKAKRYDEVVAMAKECITYIPDEAVNKYMLNMFPELKESEGERIRGNLIELFHDTLSNDEIFSDYGLDKTEVLAWLEKQGKQNPAEWHIEDEQNLNACLGYIPDEFLRRWLKDVIHAKNKKELIKL